MYTHWPQLVPTNQNCGCRSCQMPSGTFHYYLVTNLNADATSGTWQLHCYVVKFRFTSLYSKMAAAHVVSSDNMSRLHKYQRCACFHKCFTFFTLGVLVSVNFGCFSPNRFSHFHCNAMRKAISAHKNLHTNQQNEYTHEQKETGMQHEINRCPQIIIIRPDTLLTVLYCISRVQCILRMFMTTHWSEGWDHLK